MTAKTFEEWMAEARANSEFALYTMDDDLRSAWTASRAALLADRPEVAGLVERIREHAGYSYLATEVETALESLAAQLAVAKHAIEAYRGSLGYSVDGGHDGRLCDGSIPNNGIAEAIHAQLEGYPGIAHDLETERLKVSELRGRMRVMTNIMGDALSVLNTIPEEESDEETRLDDLRAKMAGAIDSVLRSEKASIYRRQK